MAEDSAVEYTQKKIFHIERQDVFLTFPQCPEAVSTFISWLNIEYPELVEYCICCQEDHKDGSKHLHSYVKFFKKKRFNELSFDFLGYHPNIGKPKNVFACINYVKKDGKFEEYGTAPIERKRKQETVSSEEIMENAKVMEEEEYFKWCLTNDVNYQYAKEFYRIANSGLEDFTIRDQYEIPVGANIDDKLLAIDLEDVKRGRKCLVLTGRSGSGKTQLALKVAPKPCLLVTHMDDLKKLKRYHKSVVFDDMSFTHFPITARIHLADYMGTVPRSINVKYGSCQLRPEQYRIFTCNSHPLLCETVSKINALQCEVAKVEETKEQREAIERRIHRVHI